MKSFEYAAPTTLKEALALLSNRRGETEILAGGTDLVTCLKQGLTRPKRVVALRRIKELQGITLDAAQVRIGAMATLREVAESPIVREKFPSVVTAIQGIASPQILAAGTIGGDLCQRPRCWYFRNGFGLMASQGGSSLVREGQNRYHAIFSEGGPALFVSASSVGPAWVALGATFTVIGADGQQRVVEAAKFFRTPQSEDERETILRADEILTEIVVPDRGLKNATYEVRHRHGLDWPYATASVAFRLDAGTASDARVVLGQVAPIPWIAREAGRAIEAARVDASSAVRCGEAATQGAQPLSQNSYKTQLVRTAVKRALLAAAGV